MALEEYFSVLEIPQAFYDGELIMEITTKYSDSTLSFSGESAMYRYIGGKLFWHSQGDWYLSSNDMDDYFRCSPKTDEVTYIPLYEWYLSKEAQF